MKKSLLFILGMAVALYADYTMVLGTGDRGDQQTVQYKDDKHIKISMDRDSGMLIIGEKAYMVENDDGQTRVIDMDEMRKMMGGMTSGLKQEAQSMYDEMDMKVIKKGKKRTVAGIKGEVWTIEFRQEGETKQSDVVVTSDKRVVKAMGAYGKAISRMAMSPEEGDDAFMSMMQIEPGYVMIESETGEEGGSFALKSFSEKAIPASTFVLPANAQKQKMPDMSALFGGSKSSSGGEEKGVLSDCFNKVCCGSTDGDAKVLTGMLRDSKNGYRLEGRPAVCNVMGFSSLFGQSDSEGGLYKKGKDDYIQITLNMNDSGEGSVETSRQQAKSGVGLVRAVKDFKAGTLDGAKYRYGYLEPMNQQTLDIFLDEDVILSVTRTSKKKIDLVSWSKGAIDIGAYHTAKSAKAPEKKSQKSSSEEDGSALDTDAISEGVSDVVDAFKGFF